MAKHMFAMIFSVGFLSACRTTTQSRVQDAGGDDTMIQIVRDTFPFLNGKDKELGEFAQMLRRRGGGGALSPESLAQLEQENGAELKIYVAVAFLARTNYLATLVSNDVDLRVLNSQNK